MAVTSVPSKIASPWLHPDRPTRMQPTAWIQAILDDVDSDRRR